jgi:hypothetical protein
MRFGEHFCAADFYKRGICRAICVEIVLDFCFGAVGFLITGAQRARGRGKSETCLRQAQARKDMKHEEGGGAPAVLPLTGLHFGGVVVVEVQDLAAGFALAVVGLVFLYDGLEGGEDVVDVFTGEAVEVEVGGV